MSSVREVAEGERPQGENESLPYTLTVTEWGSSPTATSCTVKDRTAGGVDVTTSVTTGSTSVASDTITLPLIHSLVPGHVYRVYVQFTVSGGDWEAYFDIRAEE